MHYPNFKKLPPSPSKKTGWPWTEASQLLSETMPDGTVWPRISIITPSYNQGEFLEETIRSVLLQGYPNLEYIIIDGGSTDNSVEIIRKYEPWLAYWVSEPDHGQSDAINKGMKWATGDIIAWLNSDDTYLPSALAQAATIMISSSNAVMVYAKSQLCDVNGHLQKEIGAPFSFEAMLNINNVVPQPSVFIRHSMAKQAGLLRTDLHYVMDWEYWLRLTRLGEVVFIDDATWSTYRWYPQSKTASWPLATDVELATVYEGFFNYSGLPSHIKKLRSASLWQAYTKCAKRYYSQGESSMARQYALHAIQASWQNTLSNQWRNRMISYLLGQTWAEKLINTKTRFAKWFSH